MVNLQEVRHDPEAQLANLTAAIGQNSRDGSLYARRALVLLRTGQLQQALDDADMAIRLTRNEPFSLFVKAQVLRALGRPEEALPLALQAERNSYQSASLYVLLGEMYLERGAYQQARLYLNKAQELAPDDEYAFYYKGRVAEVTGDTAQALRLYRLALKQAPAFMEPKRELSGLLLGQQRFEEARPYITTALSTDPEEGMLWYYSGLVLQASEKQDSALAAFAKAVALNDTIAGAHYWLGLQQHKLGNNEAAIAHLEKAEAIYSTEPKYLSTLASAYERTGQFMNALEAYQRLVQVAPGNSYAYQAISRLKYKIANPRPASTVVQQAQTEQ
ncbi:tetratricopeptide repeat protein [Pontibacter russatus]|uniref:tetratricopeptide repeat protein n=1 Tax=Pontibacter russatus TaxID=2694929 RepID=UPI00137A8739|nr:tetratricopeptide repeat protein [Pontibacter russatus]